MNDSTTDEPEISGFAQLFGQVVELVHSMVVSPVHWMSVGEPTDLRLRILRRIGNFSHGVEEFSDRIEPDEDILFELNKLFISRF
jgi:hypothetical protein